jgi:hypothetical protein
LGLRSASIQHDTAKSRYDTILAVGILVEKSLIPRIQLAQFLARGLGQGHGLGEHAPHVGTGFMVEQGAPVV